MKTRGFTIVELLIVIVVIAILAAITIVAYTGIQGRAYDSTVQSDMRQSYLKVQQYVIETGQVPTSQSDINALLSVTRSAYGGGGNFYIYCRVTSTNAYAIVGRSKSGNGFAYSSEGGAIAFSSWPGDSNLNLCPAASISTGDSGYSGVWIGVNGEWSAWFTPGS